MYFLLLQCEETIKDDLPTLVDEFLVPGAICNMTVFC